MIRNAEKRVYVIAIGLEYLEPSDTCWFVTIDDEEFTTDLCHVDNPSVARFEDMSVAVSVAKMHKEIWPESLYHVLPYDTIVEQTPVTTYVDKTHYERAPLFYELKRNV